MSEQKVKEWKIAQRARQNAEAWQALPSGPRYENDRFSISLVHCTAPMLTRAGQQSCGGKNYWETEKEFNHAILEWIVGNWQEVYLGVLDILKKKEVAALQDCQDYINQMQAMIDASKGE